MTDVRAFRKQILALIDKGFHIDAMKEVMAKDGVTISKAKPWVEGFVNGVRAAREERTP